MSHPQYFDQLFDKFFDDLKDTIGFLYEFIQILKTIFQVTE
jgi:hypothetical protein